MSHSDDLSASSTGAPVSTNLEQRLLELLRRRDYAPLRFEELAEALKLDHADDKSFSSILDHLLSKGHIARVKQDRYVLPQDADLSTGIVKFRQSGTAMFIPETADGIPTGEAPWHIFAEDTGTALHGDRVLVREKKRPRPWRADAARKGMKQDRIGSVIEVLKRARDTLSGTLRHDQQFWHVIPDDPRIVQDILVTDPARVNVSPLPKPGDKVLVRLQEWKERHLNPVGEIVENLGITHTPSAEFKAILHKYELRPEFPEEVLREVAGIPSEVGPRDRAGREEVKALTFTIDPDDAKDFDDALSLEHLPNGEVRIGVHIADVSAYVKPGTVLDREARARGNSTYLVGVVIPMLPHALSNGLCSLVERKDRLTKSVFFTFSAQGKVLETRFANTFIHSRKRLTYKQAYALLKENDLNVLRALPQPAAHATGSTGRALAELTDAELNELRDATRACWAIASRLRQARLEKGSLDLDFPEAKIFVDAEGYADRLEVIQNDESHQLIEEFMLLANEAVARTLHEAGLPFLSRVHDQPDPEKLSELRDHLATFGVKAGDLTHRKEVTRLLAQIKTHPQGHALKTQFLRSLKQACYRATLDGHYGLFKKFYTHFTSPIRRYSDLVIHRIFDHYLEAHGQPIAGGAAPRYSQAALDELGRHLSTTERNSTDAERETVKLKLLEYFERESKRVPRVRFPALITDLRNHGFFIELRESLAWGFVPLSSLEDDLYFLANDGRELIGRRTKRQFQLGSEILVEVYRVDRFKRQMDFRVAPLEGSQAAPRSQAQPARQQSRSGPPQSPARHSAPRSNAGPRPRSGSGQNSPRTSSGQHSQSDRPQAPRPRQGQHPQPGRSQPPRSGGNRPPSSGQQGSGQRGPNRGPDSRGPDSRGSSNRGPSSRGYGQGGGSSQRGSDNREPSQGGGSSNRGSDNRGSGNRGPSQGGGGGSSNRGRPQQPRGRGR
jgi:ribonuclease R